MDANERTRRLPAECLPHRQADAVAAMAEELERLRGELADTRTRLRELRDLAGVGCWDLDLVTGRLDWSEEIFRIFEVEPERFRASYDAFLSFVHPQDRAAVDDAWRTAVATGAPYAITHRVLLPDGREKHVHERGHLAYDAGGKPTSARGTVVDVTAFERAQRARAESEARFRAMVEDQTEFILFWEPGVGISFVNAAARRLLAMGPDEAELRGWSRFLYPDDQERVRGVVHHMRPDSPLVQTEARIALPDGSVRWTEWTIRGFFDAAGGIRGIQAVGRDVTDARAAANRIAAQLAEKDVLLREIHHRVKNNLQVVSSLLFLQKEAVGSPELGALLDESRQRISAMALVHQQLCTSASVRGVDMLAYARDLARGMFVAYGADARRVRLDVGGESFVLPLDRAIPAGLVLNELLSNALKHAFPGDREGVVEVRLGRSERHRSIAVRDDGVGFARVPDDAGPSLGLRLLPLLASQLRGHVVPLPGPGVGYRLEFPAEVE